MPLAVTCCWQSDDMLRDTCWAVNAWGTRLACAQSSCYHASPCCHAEPEVPSVFHLVKGCATCEPDWLLLLPDSLTCVCQVHVVWPKPGSGAFYSSDGPLRVQSLADCIERGRCFDAHQKDSTASALAGTGAAQLVCCAVACCIANADCRSLHLNVSARLGRPGRYHKALALLIMCSPLMAAVVRSG